MLMALVFIKIGMKEYLIEMHKRNYVLAYNIQIDELISQGFKKVYDKLYSHSTSSDELNNIKSQCNQNSIICVGGTCGSWFNYYNNYS